ncbi:MAG: elongation factor P [Candidatus Pacebacteria bacterium]|nr:elongation factor P [Candidatus Paceibacterota bacterium]
MLSYSEITIKKYIVFNNEPFEVLSSNVFRMQKRKPVNQTKLRSLLSGKVIEYSFHQSDKAEEANIEKKNVIYLYSHRGEHWFGEEGNRSKRFTLSPELVEDKLPFMKQNSIIEGLVFNNVIIGISLPPKVELEVAEAPPTVKGNTSQGATKQVALETGLSVRTPLFIKEGDVVRVNTNTGEYAERV